MNNNRLQEINDFLQNLVQKQKETIDKQEAENKRLREEKSKLENKIDEIYLLVMQLPNAMQQAKSEAYKEFAEEIFELFPKDKPNTVISRVTVKHILKELVGENNE